MFLTTQEIHFHQYFDSPGTDDTGLCTILFMSIKADFLSWQKSLAYSLRIFVDNFSLLSTLQRVLAAWLKIFN